MSDDAQKAEELLQQSKKQKRHETEPTEVEPDLDNTQSLEDAVREAYHKLEADDIPENLTIRDTNLAALFYGLDQSGELERVGEEAADRLGRDSDDTGTKAGVLRLVVRIALNELDESLMESGKDGLDRYEDEKKEEF